VVIKTRNKKGVSAVVANVLILVLVLAAVGILIVVVYSFFPDNLFTSYENGVRSVKAYYNNVEIPSQVSNVDPTADVTLETLFVIVERNNEEQEWAGLNFIFSVEGNSYTCERTNVPGKSNGIVYVFQSSSLAVKPESVKVVPILRVDGNTRNGPVVKVDIGETSKVFSEKISECGGFCCDMDSDLPINPTI